MSAHGHSYGCSQEAASRALSAAVGGTLALAGIIVMVGGRRQLNSRRYVHMIVHVGQLPLRHAPVDLLSTKIGRLK